LAEKKLSRGSLFCFSVPKNQRRTVVIGVSMSGVNGWTVCRFHGARGGAPEAKRNGNYRHGARTRATIELWRFIKSRAE
jgi:hypothetical protein